MSECECYDCIIQRDGSVNQLHVLRDELNKSREWAWCYLNHIIQTEKRETWEAWKFVRVMAKDIDSEWINDTEFSHPRKL